MLIDGSSKILASFAFSGEFLFVHFGKSFDILYFYQHDLYTFRYITVS